MRYSAILLAAGKGTRYQEIKQDLVFHGKALWKYAYEATLKNVPEERIVIVGKDIPGGKTRTGSVFAGLEAIPKDTDRIVIVEAARPMVTEKQIKELLDDTHPSATFVRPLVNTVVYRNGTYINRDELYELLTPQAFDFKLLLDAFRHGGFTDMTDETRIMFEYHGIKPHFIETDANPFKVTYPGDLDIVESIYNAQIHSRMRSE